MSRCSLAWRLLPVLVLSALAGVLLPLWGQEPGGKKYALLVGINTYEHEKLTPLRYAENDARGLSKVLQEAGYEVVLLTGSARTRSQRPTKANIETRLKEVLGKCRRGDMALVALAGHGLQFEGKKDAFFCPVDARPLARRTDSLLSLKKVYDELEESLASVKLLLVDACRNDPESSRGVDTAPRPPRGVAALFSCSAGEKAFETDKLGGGHGVFFHFVIEGLRGKAKNAKGAVTLHSLAEYVVEQVSDEVPKVIRDGARQTPHQMLEIKGKSPVLLAKASLPRPVGDDTGVKRSRPVLPKFAGMGKGKKYALLVGVREYEHAKLPNLRYTDNDMEDLGRILEQPGSGFAQVRLLTTTRGKVRPADAPTAANIRTALATLLRKPIKHDLVLLALAGHGVKATVRGRDEAFFCPSDARPTDPASMLNFRDLFRDLGDSGAGANLLLVDACRGFSNRFDADLMPRPSRGVAALFSCSSGQLAFEINKLRHGIFFHYVIEGLKGKAKNEEGKVTWDSLTTYVTDQVSRQAPLLIGGGARQTPHQTRNLTGDAPVLLRFAR
jgi:uncharacterized caspase-like protein